MVLRSAGWCPPDSLIVANRVGLATWPTGWCPADSLIVANRVGLATNGKATDRVPPNNYRPSPFSTFPQLVRQNGSICRFPHCEKRRDPFGRKGFQLMRTCRNRCFSTVSTGPSQGNSTLTRWFSTGYPQGGGFSTGLSTGPRGSFFFFLTVSTRCDPREKG